MKRIDLIIIILYSILTIILTYPVAFVANKIPGHGDVFQFLWIFWLFKETLLDCINPYFTNYIFFPSGVSLAFSTITPLNSIVSIPLQLAFGLVNAYKIIWILTFILSGFGTFLLVKYKTNDTRAAFVAGLIFMFCPYRFAHALGHINLLSTQWIPFFILYLLKTLHETKKTNALFAATFLFLTTISCYYYLIYLLTFSLLYILYQRRLDEKFLNLEMVKRMGTLTLFFILISFPFMYPLIRELIISKSTYMYGGEFVKYSADLLGFFVPQEFHPIYKYVGSNIYNNFSGGPAEYTVFIGYIVILLSIFCLIKINTPEVKFWALSAGVFFILSLGPVLHINGVVNFYLKNYSLFIPLPYAILMRIPIFSMARVPSRWDVLLMISLAILSGYSLNYIFNRYSDKKYAVNIILILVSCFIIFEYLSIPFLMSDTKIPEFYENISIDHDDYAILEVPILGYADSMYYQTVHQKKLVGGYVSRIPYDAIEFLTYTPLIRDLLNLYPTKDIIEQNVSEIGPSIFNYYNIKYIILHGDRLNAEQLIFASRLIEKSAEDPLIFENDSMVAFKVKKEPIGSFAVLRSGWHGLENWNETPTRWMSNDAGILIYSDKNCTADLSLQTLSFYCPRTLEIYINDQPWMWADVPTDGFVVINVPINLNKGANVLKLQVPEGCDKPCDIHESKSDDKRCLSLAIQNITISYGKTS